MVISCCAYNCKNRHTTGKSNEKISFFRFPTDPLKLKIWLARIRRKNWKPSKNTTICSAHFTPDCYEQSPWSSIRKLKPGAIPTLFDFGQPVGMSRRGDVSDKLPNLYEDKTAIIHRLTLSIEKNSSILESNGTCNDSTVGAFSWNDSCSNISNMFSEDGSAGDLEEINSKHLCTKLSNMTSISSSANVIGADNSFVVSSTSSTLPENSLSVFADNSLLVNATTLSSIDSSSQSTVSDNCLGTNVSSENYFAHTSHPITYSILTVDKSTSRDIGEGHLYTVGNQQLNVEGDHSVSDSPNLNAAPDCSNVNTSLESPIRQRRKRKAYLGDFDDSDFIYQDNAESFRRALASVESKTKTIKTLRQKVRRLQKQVIRLKTLLKECKLGFLDPDDDDEIWEQEMLDNNPEETDIQNFANLPVDL